MNQVTPEFITTNRQFAAYIFATRALEHLRTTKTVDDDRNPVQWSFADPDNLGAKLAEGFHDGTAQVSARAYAKHLSKSLWTVKRFRDSRMSAVKPATDERAAPGFRVPAEWLTS
jgi:hypothetical protein